MRGFTDRLWLLLGLVPLLLAFGGRPVLPPQAAQGFQRLISLVNDEQRLGDGYRITNVSIERAHATVSLSIPTAPKPVDVVFEHPSDRPTATQCRHFAVARPPGWQNQQEFARFLALVDAAFAKNPWISPRERHEISSRNLPAVAPTLPRRWVVTGVALLLLAAVGSGAWLLTRPRA